MTQQVVHSQTGLVDVLWRQDIGAVHVKWHTEYDEGDGVQNAVRAAVRFVIENKIRNWLVDISDSDHALSDKDYAWVSSDEFRALIGQSTLRRFVMIPPGPDSKQDTSWIAGWERNTLNNFGNGIAAKVSSDMAEISAFFASEPAGENQ